MLKRVAVTGLGIVSPIGIGVEANWEAALKGHSGIGPITKFDASDCKTQIAGEEVTIAQKQIVGVTMAFVELTHDRLVFCQHAQCVAYVTLSLHPDPTWEPNE